MKDCKPVSADLKTLSSCRIGVLPSEKEASLIWSALIADQEDIICDNKIDARKENAMSRLELSYRDFLTTALLKGIEVMSANYVEMKGRFSHLNTDITNDSWNVYLKDNTNGMIYSIEMRVR